MQNDETTTKNGQDPIDAYLRDVSLWKERLERQRLEIIGHVQRKLHSLVEQVRELNERGGFELTMHDECFAEDLRALGLEVTGAPPRTPSVRTMAPRNSVRAKFDEFLSMYKPGERVTRQDWGKFGSKDYFDFNIIRAVKNGKVKKLGKGEYVLA